MGALPPFCDIHIDTYTALDKPLGYSVYSTQEELHMQFPILVSKKWFKNEQTHKSQEGDGEHGNWLSVA